MKKMTNLEVRLEEQTIAIYWWKSKNWNKLMIVVTIDEWWMINMNEMTDYDVDVYLVGAQIHLNKFKESRTCLIGFEMLIFRFLIMTSFIFICI